MFKNIWNLDLDIKFRYTSVVPYFRRKDSVVFRMKMFDAKEKLDISGFSKATLDVMYPSERQKQIDCTQAIVDGEVYVECDIAREFSMEIGNHDAILSIEKDGGIVSTQKFTIITFDNIGKPELAYVKMIQDLQNQIAYLENTVGNILPKSLIGQANGVVELDDRGKVPVAYMPLFLEDHINTNVYLKMVHGFMIDKDRKLIYETKDGNTEYIGHKDNSGKNNRLNLIVSVVDSVATLRYYGKGNPVLQKWMFGNKSLSEIKNSGTLFTGLTFNISKTGIHTIYYTDNYGNEYLYKFSVLLSQIKEPKVDISVDKGKVVIDSDMNLTVKKIGKGRQTIEWFSNNGTVISDGFKLTEAGEYTVYYKDEYGREFVKYITVTEDKLIGDDDLPPEITFTTNPKGASKIDVTGKISISDTSEIIDRRYVFAPFSSNSGRKTIDEFRKDRSLGVKISSNTIEFKISENGWVSVYAMDKLGNDVIGNYSVTNIDKKPPTLRCYDYWDDELNLYIIEIEATDMDSGIKKITFPDGTYKEVNGSYRDNSTFETAVYGNKKFILEDNAGNIKEYTVIMKGKVTNLISTRSGGFILREDGKTYGYGTNSEGELGIGSNDSILNYYEEFIRVNMPKKVKKFVDTDSEASLFLDVNGDMWECGKLKGIAYNDVNNVMISINNPRMYNVMRQVDDVIDSYDPTGMTAVKKSGKWFGCGFNMGQFGNGTGESNYIDWEEIGTKSPQQFTDIVTDGSATYYFGTDGKMYASGMINDGQQLGFPPTAGQNYRIYPTPKECVNINPHGKTVKVLSDRQRAWFYMENGKLVQAGDYTNKTTVFNGLPAKSVVRDMSTSLKDYHFYIAFDNSIYIMYNIGSGTEVKYSGTFEKFLWDKNLSKISGNKDTIMALDDKGALYMSKLGENGKFSQFSYVKDKFFKYEDVQ